MKCSAEDWKVQVLNTSLRSNWCCNICWSPYILLTRNYFSLHVYLQSWDTHMYTHLSICIFTYTFYVYTVPFGKGRSKIFQQISKLQYKLHALFYIAYVNNIKNPNSEVKNTSVTLSRFFWTYTKNTRPVTCFFLFTMPLAL